MYLNEINVDWWLYMYSIGITISLSQRFLKTPFLWFLWIKILRKWLINYQKSTSYVRFPEIDEGFLKKSIHHAFSLIIKNKIQGYSKCRNIYGPNNILIWLCDSVLVSHFLSLDFFFWSIVFSRKRIVNLNT